VAASLGSAAEATSLVFVNGSRVIGGDEMGQLMEIDVDAKSTRILCDQLPPEWNFLSGAVTCGQKWYGLATRFPNGGIASVDLSSGAFEGVTMLNFVPDALTCGEQSGEVLVAGFSGSSFALMKVGVKDGTAVSIGTFPEDALWGGWQSIFQFHGEELQATFPKKGFLASDPNTGEVYRMNTRTGEITMHKQIKGTPGAPYYLQHSDSGSTTGLFGHAKEDAWELSFCVVDLAASEVQVSRCQKVDVNWWGSGRAPVQCPGDALHYFVSIGGRMGSYTPIFGANMEDGSLAKEFHLDYAYGDISTGHISDYYEGSVACSTAAPLVI
jgi:hypothetical protein